MLLDNIWIQRGLVNGAIGVVRGLIQKTTTNDADIPSTAPHVILVEFDKLPNESPVSVEVDGRHCIPIFSITQEYQTGSQQCTHTQFPLTLSYAITVYKS